MKLKILIATIVFAPTALLAQNQKTAQSSSAQARIDASMRAAAEADIPASLLSSKVREGRAKNVPEERVAAAVESRLKSLLRASAAMDKAGVEIGAAGNLAVAADALEAGVSETALIRLSRSAPEERRVVAIAVLADLVRLGQGSESALARVNAAVTTSTALANLSAEIASQLRLGGLTPTLDATGILRLQ